MAMKRDRAFAKLVARLYRDLQVLFDKLRLRNAWLEGQLAVYRERARRAEERLADEQQANAHLADALEAERFDHAETRTVNESLKRALNDSNALEKKVDPWHGVSVPDHLPEKLR